MQFLSLILHQFFNASIFKEPGSLHKNLKMLPNPKETVDLVTFTEEILDGKLIFCAVFDFFSNYLITHNAMVGKMKIT